MDMVHQFSMDLYFESAGMILALITLGKYFEARAKGRTSEAIEKLMDLAPKMAVVERNGFEQQIPVEEVQTGDIPDSLDTLFSTLDEHAEHVMPVISNCSFFIISSSLHTSPVG